MVRGRKEDGEVPVVSTITEKELTIEKNGYMSGEGASTVHDSTDAASHPQGRRVPPSVADENGKRERERERERERGSDRGTDTRRASKEPK